MVSVVSKIKSLQPFIKKNQEKNYYVTLGICQFREVKSTGSKIDQISIILQVFPAIILKSTQNNILIFIKKIYFLYFHRVPHENKT